jgi:DNA-directed RNA polymerase sigma subunit (sigma70/sigma32)
MLTTKQAAQQLGLSYKRVCVLCKTGKIKAKKEKVVVQWGRKSQWVMTQEALDQYALEKAKIRKLEIDLDDYDLTTEERLVLTLRQHQTFAQIGEFMEYSRQRAHQLWVRAMGKIAKQNGN